MTLVETLVSYLDLPTDWDGYGGTAPTALAVFDAVRLVLRLPARLPAPRPMLSGAGVVGLYWERGEHYVSLDFDGSGRYCYVADNGERQRGGDGLAVHDPIPVDLLETIQATAPEA